MQWSKNILKKDKAKKTVLDFIPQKFELGTTQQAIGYLREKEKGSDFRMNDTIRVQTGVDKIEEKSEKEKIENLALEKLKEVQETAYSEGYNYGLLEGKQKAYADHARVLKEKVAEFETMMAHFSEMKTEIFNFNESHLIQLLFHMASKIAQHELEHNRDTILDVLKNAVSTAQDEENIVVQVSASQFEFLEELKKHAGREFEFLKKIKFEPNQEITAGGCIVETNYGEVDSRTEQRVQSLWENLKENLPRVKSRLTGE